MTSDREVDAVTPYAEDGCARRWPLLVLGVGMLALMVLFTVCGTVTGNEAFILPGAVAVSLWVFTGSCQVFQYWPTGIRIDGDGIRIGGVRRAERGAEARTPRRKPPAPSFQCYQVFSVSWAGVRSITVATDRKQLRQLRKQSRRGPTSGARARMGQVVGFMLGMLVPPFTRAALVIDVDLECAHVPEFRTQQALVVATSQVGTPSPTWVVPTRRPRQLQAVVDQITSSAIR